MTTEMDRLREIIDYDAETGVFRWRYRRTASAGWNARLAGNVAGTIDEKGRRAITFDGHRTYASRLAWFYVTGKWPSGQLDHINRKRDDDRFANLREATTAQNCANQTRRRNNTSGHKGVSWLKKNRKWIASISANSKQVYLGSFKTKEAAAAAYAEAAARYHGVFARVAD